jgi:thioredoxin reductase (NADPH)
MTEQNFDVAVIGGGAAGQMAALRGVLNNMKVVWFLGDKESGRKSRALWVSYVHNMPNTLNDKRPITNATKDVIEFVDNHEHFSENLTVVKEAVTDLQKSDGSFSLKAGDQTYSSQFTILCTGVMDVQPEIQGSIEPVLPFANKHHIDYCIRCDGHQVMGKNTAIIGHGMGAGWIAVMLHERYDVPQMTVLTNGKPFEGNDDLLKLMKAYNIEVHEEPIDEILGDAKSIVYNDLVKPLGVELNDRDHLVVGEKYQTSVDGLYAAGDLVAGKKKQIYTSWDMAVDAVDDMDRRLREQKRKTVLAS